MGTPGPSDSTRWAPLAVAELGDLLAPVATGWWLSGGVALDHWLGRPIRERSNVDVSVVPTALGALAAALPGALTPWVTLGDELVPLADAPAEADLQPVRLYDAAKDAWVLQVNIEDGTEQAWLYRRDPRLQLPWSRAVLPVGGVPTGAPEVQLVWKALRPRPEDDVDKEAVLPALSDEARAWWERTILTVHPHSVWAIGVRSPFAPAKASWNRRGR